MANKRAQWTNNKLLCVLGILFSGTAYLAHMVNWITPSTLYTTILAGAVTVAYSMYSIRFKDIDKFFRFAGFEKDSITPTVLDKHEYEDGFSYIVRIPPGMCLSDFEKKKEAFDQFFNGSVDFAFKDNLIINVRTTPLKEFYKYDVIYHDEPLKVAIGYSRKGVYNLNIEKAIHVLIAGSTGAGKSVLLRSIITSLILTKHPEDICIHLVDFMRVELGIFKNSYMINDFSYTPDQFMNLLKSLTAESTRRLKMFEKESIVTIKKWNERHPDNKLPYHVVFVDEFAALADKKYKPIIDLLKIRMAQDRKCGIHYVLCTQRPSKDVIDSVIKANLPTRICLKTASDADSNIVLDTEGAEKLRGKGHALVMDGTELLEVQTMYLDEEQAQEMISHTYQERPIEIEETDDTSGVIAI